MKKVLNISLVALTLAIVSLLLFCTDFKNNNPATTAYQGNYALSCSWSQLSDTLEVFKRYAILCVQGGDTFSTYKVDSSVFPLVIDAIKRASVDTITVHFFRAINDTDSIMIEGVRPNNLTTGAVITAHVINPYFIKPKATAVNLGDTIIVSVSRSDNKPVDPGLFTLWNSNGKEKSRQSESMPDTIIPASRDTQIISAFLQDSIGEGLYLDTVRIPVGGYKQRLDSVKLKSNAALGAPLTLTIAQTDLDSSMFMVYVASSKGWRDSSEFRAFTGADTVRLKRPVMDTGPQFDTVYTRDAGGVTSNVQVLSVTVAYSLPVVGFSKDSLIVPLNDSAKVELSQKSTAKKFVWVLDTNTKRQDTTVSPSYVIFLRDTLPHKLSVKGVDSFNLAGAPASIRLHAQPFAYSIRPIAFPVYPKVNTWTTWIAAVDDTAFARKKNARFHWAMDPPNYDSIQMIGTDSSTLKLFWSGVAATTITLTITDNFNNGCAPYTQGVSVRRYAPLFKFADPKRLEVKTTDSIRLVFSAIDSSIDGTATSGSIRKILLERTGKAALHDSLDAGETSWLLTPTDADTFDVYAWARDTGGTPSQPDTVHIFVKAYPPFIKPKTDDITVYINSSVTLNVSGQVSDTTAKIAKYLWDFDGNGVWDDTSTNNQITHKFSSPGKAIVIVKCSDTKKLESVPDTFFVTVSTGTPRRPVLRPDTVWIYDNTRYTLTSKAMNPNASLVRHVIQWDSGGALDIGGLWDNDTTAIVNHAYTTSGLKQVAYYVYDNNGYVSDTVKETIAVRLGAPLFKSVVMDSLPAQIFVHDFVHFFIHASDSNGRIDSMKASWDGATVFNTVNKNVQGDSAVFGSAFATPGTRQIRFRVYDNDGLWADTTFWINVQLGRPFVSSIALDTPASKIYINQPVRFFVHGRDNNGHIDSIKASWNGDTNSFTQKFTAINDSAMFTNTFTAIGANPVRFRVYDDDGLTADSAVTITVRQGKPVITSIATDTPSTRIFTGQPIKFTVNGMDTNGAIVGVKVAWNNNLAELVTIPLINGAGVSQYTFTQTQTGPHVVIFRVYDNDQYIRDSSLTIFVHTGRPVVTSITPDSILFINDARKFAIATYDTNGTVDSVKIDNGSGSFGAFVKTTAGGYSLNRVFARTEAGSKTIKVIAKDNEGLLSDTAKLLVMVRLGAPVVDRITIDTAGNNLFVKDVRKYSVSARDTNGFVKMIFFNWNNGATADDTVTIVRNTASIDTFIYHVYDTTMFGQRTVRTWAQDEDTIASSKKDTVVTVRPGAPVLWGDNTSRDTTWMVVNNGYGISYNAHINSFDTNGTISRYYWSEAGSFDSTTATKTNDSLYSRLIGINDVNKGFPIWIYGRDNDGLVRGGQFMVFADSAPPKPTIINAPLGDIVNGLTLRWTNQDVKDGTGTLFQILISYDSSDPSIIQSDFKPGTQYTINGSEFRFTFVPTNVTFKIKVVAKDARGSTSASDISAYSY